MFGEQYCCFLLWRPCKRSMVKQILGQIESKRAGQMEVPDRAALAGANSAKPNSNPGTAATAPPPSHTCPHVPPQQASCHPYAVPVNAKSSLALD